MPRMAHLLLVNGIVREQGDVAKKRCCSAGTWARNQLFLVTPSAVVLVFAAAGGGSGRIVGLGGTADPFVEVSAPRERDQRLLVLKMSSALLGTVFGLRRLSMLRWTPSGPR